MFFSQHKERRYRQRLELLNDRYKNILGIFENEVLTDLNRLRTVSLTNKNFVNIYENYNNQYDSIIQCQLARERIFDKYEMTKEKVIGTKDQDFP